MATFFIISFVYRSFATTVSQLKIFQAKRFKGLKCYTFLWVQLRHNCSPAASFTKCVMILYLLKVHLQTLLSIPIAQKCQNLSCDKWKIWRYHYRHFLRWWLLFVAKLLQQQLLPLLLLLLPTPLTYLEANFIRIPWTAAENIFICVKD